MSQENRILADLEQKISQQSEALEALLQRYLDKENHTAHLEGGVFTLSDLRRVDSVILTGFGQSWNAALWGKNIIEQLAYIPARVECPRRLRFESIPISSTTLIIFVSRSGETEDLLRALQEVKRKGHKTLAISNIENSSMADEADSFISLHSNLNAASFVRQCVGLLVLGLYLGRLNLLSERQGQDIIGELQLLPSKLRTVTDALDHLRGVAWFAYEADNVFLVGDHAHYASVLEGALYLKRFTRMQVHGYRAAEVTYASMHEGSLCVCVMPTVKLVQTTKGLGRPVIAVVDELDDSVCEVADRVIKVPHVPVFLQPIITAVCLQLLAYHIALVRDTGVGSSQNMEKGITVD